MFDFYSQNILYEVKDIEDVPEHKVAKVCMFKDVRLFPVLMEIKDNKIVSCFDIMKQLLKKSNLLFNPKYIINNEKYQDFKKVIEND